jgi:hypothetical protein
LHKDDLKERFLKLIFKLGRLDEGTRSCAKDFMQLTRTHMDK